MLVQEIADFLTSLKVYHDKDLTWAKKEKLAQEFGLYMIGVGSTRMVFKKKWGRTVFKIGCPYSNRSEYAISRATSGTGIEHIFCECRDLSKNGLVLEQTYMSRVLDKVGRYVMLDLEKFFMDNFKFGKLGAINDVHSSNLAATKSGEIKLIDYSVGLKKIDLKLPLEKMEEMLRKNLPDLEHKPQFFLTNDKTVCLRIGPDSKESPRVTEKQFHECNY